MDALLISPASLVHVTIAKTIAGLFYAVMGVGLAFALNAHLIVQWWLAILAALCGSLLTVGLGLLVGSLTEVRQQTSSWAWGMAAPLFIPLILSIMDDLLPAWLIAILQWFPSVALFKVLRVSLSKQAPLAYFGPQLALILAFAAPVLGLVAWRARQTDQ